MSSNTHHKASGVECHAALQEVPQQSREDGHVRNVQHLQWKIPSILYVTRSMVAGLILKGTPRQPECVQ